MQVPETRYAKSGDVHVAYQEFGAGSERILLAPGWVSHIEYAWEEPSFAGFLEQLGSFARVVWFDKRGTGLSDRVAGLPILEERMDDLRAVMDAVGWSSATVFGVSEGGSMSALFAASYPARVDSLILYGVFARRLRAPDYPWAPTLEERERWISSLESGWGGDVELSELAPSRVQDLGFRRWFATYGRLSVSPSAAVALARMNTLIDIRGVLPAIRVPTLVLHRTGDRDVQLENGRYLSEQIRGAKFVELAGEDHLPWTGDVAALLGEVEEFVTGGRSPAPTNRVLATVLFSDIVGSTERATVLGDQGWTETLARHNQAVRKELARFSGREVKTTGDGFLAVFDGPARAVRCGAAIQASAKAIGLTVRIGVHTGECEQIGTDIGGIGVHIASRVAHLSDGHHVLATSTVKDLTSGSGIDFRELGERLLKGVSERWRLYEATVPETR